MSVASVAPAGRSARSLIIAGLLVLLLVIAAAVAAVTLGSRGPASFPADSPQEAFQSYYQAYQSRDTDAAYQYFSQRVQRQVSRDEYSRVVGPSGLYTSPEERNARILVDRVEQTDDHATLYLIKEMFIGTGIDATQFSSERQVRLVREGGAWKIDDALMGIDPLPLPIKPAI